MNYDRATIPIKPRGTLELLDLSLFFLRTHLGLMMRIVALFGLPIIAIAIGVSLALDQVWIAPLVLWLLLPLLSGAIVLSASRLVFGVPLELGHALSIYRPLVVRYFIVRLGQRLIWIPFLPLVFGEMLRLSWTFTPMVYLLERLSGKPLVQRRRALYRRSGGNAFALDLAVLTVAAVFVLALCFCLDLVFSDFFKLWDSRELFDLMALSPLKVSLWSAVILVVSPLVDLTWFFFYLDTRIRQEGWDIELGFRDMALRFDRFEKEPQ